MEEQKIYELLNANLGFYLATMDGDQPRVRGMMLFSEYSCAMKSHFRKSGNQMSGKWKSSYASLLA